MHPEIDPLVEEEIKVEIGEIIETITDTIIETDQEADGTIIGVTITRITIDEVILDKMMDKMLREHLEPEVKVEIELEIAIMTIQEVEVGIEIMTGPFQPRQSTLSHGRNESRSRSNLRVGTTHDCITCYRCREYNHFASECPNTPTDEQPDYDDADPASLHMMTQEHYPIDSEGEVEYLKLVKGKNGTTSFSPSKEKTGGKIDYIQNKETMCLTKEQTNYVYKTVEEGNIINTNMMTHETMQNQDDNPYKKVVVNKVFREEDKSPEMKNWSIFSDNVRYIQHEPITPHKLDIDTLDYRHQKELYLKLKGEERETLDIDFGIYPNILKSKYLDIYEGVYAEMVYANKFNENSDLSTTYLGQTKMTRDTKIKAEERFPITGQEFASGKLLDRTECQILLDTGATKSYMSKSYYL